MNMKLIEFTQHFPDEQSCRIAFRDYRLKVGLNCRKCGCTRHYWMKTIEQFQCKECGTRMTLRKGTVMEDSNLPFRIWFIAIHLMTSVKKPISAKEMQRQLGHPRYEPIWYMMKMTRVAMGSRDEQRTLSGMVEIDEGFFTTVDSDNRGKRKPRLKRGRGSQKPIMREPLVSWAALFTLIKPRLLSLRMLARSFLGSTLQFVMLSDRC